MPPPPVAAERLITEPETEYAVTSTALATFAKNVAMDVNLFLSGATEQSSRYVVISVDPAGGGDRSEEAFVVFLVAGDRFALLTAHAIHGHHDKYPFSTIPLVFVLALLNTVRAVKRLLQKQDRAILTMPPVIVVMETNFAYGAAVYMQMLWFIERQQAKHPDLAGVEILFATPVYLWDDSAARYRIELGIQQGVVSKLGASLQPLGAKVRAAWRDKGPKTKFMVMTDFVDAVLSDLVRKQDPGDVKDVDTRVTEIMVDLKTKATANGVPDSALQNLKPFEDALKEMVTARRLLMDARSSLQRIQVRLKNAELGENGDPGDFIRTRPWPTGHTVESPVKIAFPDNYWWNAKKSALGEITTRQEKVRAFRHWVALVSRAQGPHPASATMHIAKLKAGTAGHPGATRGSADRGACALVLQKPGRIESSALPLPSTVLACVHDQWRRLQVFVSADNNAILRIEGKATNNEDDKNDVFRDDVWMAFSIGMQWCARFTRRLPDNAHRAQLVQYMRDIRGRVHKALVLALRDAEVVATEEAAPAPPAAPVVADVPADAAPPDMRPLAALVAVAGVTSAASTAVSDLRELLRTFILAYAAAGYDPPSEHYRIRVRRVARNPATAGAKYWQQRVALAVLDEGGDGASRMATIEKLYGRTSSTLKTVCASPPGARYAWPGLSAGRRRRARDGEARATLQELVAELRGRLDTLSSAAAVQCAEHAESHPILRTPETKVLFDLFFERLRGLAAHFGEILKEDGGGDARALYEQHSIRELNRQIWMRRDAPSIGKAMPMAPLLMLTQLAEDAAFLRRMANFGRQHIIKALEPLPRKRWDVPAVAPVPGVSCRLFQRRIMPWRHVFKTTWPYVYNADRYVQPPGAPGPAAVCFQAHIELLPWRPQAAQNV